MVAYGVTLKAIAYGLIILLMIIGVRADDGRAELAFNVFSDLAP